MFRKKISTALTLLLVSALMAGSINTRVMALTQTETLDNGIVLEKDPAITKAQNSASAVSTGTQNDARENREENEKNHPSEYSKLDSDISEETKDGNKAVSGDGKEETAEGEEGSDESVEAINWEVIHISTAEDVVKLAKNCRLDAYSSNKKIYLDNDINMTDSKFTGIPYFNGCFYGCNHTISNIMIKDEKSYMGFFSRIGADGLVSDLNVSGRVTPPGAQTIVGGLAGDNEGVISNCFFDGVVSGEDYVGGIAGINELSGIIMDSSSEGVISGTHFTGGIAGENMGNIIRCTNNSGVNITNRDSAVSIEDISVDSIMSMVGIGDTDKDEAEASAMINGVVDMGGIAGVSIGVIQYCENKAAVGYTNVGYNVGGIAGRQSGYIYSCNNSGKILGRKDVGGIVGQAEPYVTIDFANDITSQLSENIEKLHDILTVTLNNADSSSDTISARLSVIKNFTDQALSDTRYIENETIDWANGMVASANEALSRIDYIMDEAAKKDGVMDKTNAAASDAKTAMSQFETTVKDLDLEKYMSPTQKADYEEAKKNLEAISEEFAGYEAEVNKKAAENYCIHYYIGQDEYNGTSEPSTATVNEQNVKYKKSETGEYVFVYASHSPAVGPKLKGDVWTNSDNETYGIEGSWVHNVSGQEDAALGSTSDEAQNSLDAKLSSAATKGAADLISEYAEKKYKAAHAGSVSYLEDVKTYGLIMTGIIADVGDDMTDQTRTDAQKAVKSLESSMANIQSAGEQAKSIINTLNNKSDISLPSFSAEYKQHANSLTNNIQGMSDNFGLLNSEMNGASDKLINDLQGVNDQFNVIMLLFTDAIDGVLDNDYSNSYTDGSLEVCNTTTDATVDSCTNEGTVEGSIDVAGICGTMAIEYDFDLESDVTGLKDAVMNKSYQTKCVLRNDINRGLVTAQKNYAGGVCGLQEMGTITEGQNYNTITSSTASYVGGIAGSSVSNIVRGYSKCTLSGKTYVGGIVGDGTRIYDSFAMVKIDDATSWYGAIAGHVDDNSDIKNNYFVGDDLAGIDRVSYKGEAEPVSYSYAEETIGSIPAYFGSVHIDFVLDEDEEDDDNETVLLKTGVYSYGQNIEESEYPEVPLKEGYYAVWDIPSIESLEHDEIVTATYVRSKTTLAGNIVRGSNQSAILVDGAFKEGDELDAELCVNQPDALTDSQEYWNISIPDDGLSGHVIRYIKADNMDKWPDIYVYDNGSWVLIDEKDISTMGSYKTFFVSGNNVKLQMTYSDAKRKTVVKALIIAGSIIGALIIIVLIIAAVRSRKRVKRRVQKRAEAIRKRAEAREPAIKFVEEGEMPETAAGTNEPSDAEADNRD